MRQSAKVLAIYRELRQTAGINATAAEVLACATSLVELFSVEDTTEGIRFGTLEQASWGSWSGFSYHGHRGSMRCDASGLCLDIPGLLTVRTECPVAIREFVAKWEEGFKEVMGVKTRSQESPVVYGLRKLYYRTLQRLSDTQLVENFTG